MSVMWLVSIPASSSGGVVTCPHRRPDRMCTAVGIYGGIKRICDWCLCLCGGEICSRWTPHSAARFTVAPFCTGMTNWPHWSAAEHLSAWRSEPWACHQADYMEYNFSFPISFCLLIVFYSHKEAYHTCIHAHTHTNTLQFIDVITWI